jgi:hypothetical protein
MDAHDIVKVSSFLLYVVGDSDFGNRVHLQGFPGGLP